MILFTNHITNQHKQELEKNAINISNKLSTFLGNKQNNNHMMPGYGAYLQFLQDTSMYDAWIVDKDMNVISSYCQQMNIEYKDFPKGADTVIQDAFKGHTSFSESFSDILNTKTITVGTPVKDLNSKIIAVVLLHSPIEGISSIINNGVKTLLISILIALILAILVSTILSISFTKPLNKMKNVAIKLSKEDYNVKTNIKENNEIGELASTIDMLSEKLYKASKESEHLEKMRKDFISNISHELRTPVTVIRGSLEAFCDGIITEPKKIDEYHHQMLNESIHLQRLVNDLLDISRLQNPDFPITMNSLNLLDVINNVIRSMKPIANKKNINIILESNVDIYKLKGDYDRLLQMFSIVIDNSIKFSKENKPIYIKINKSDVLTLSVLDKGCGIEPENIDHIFDRFHKSQSENNKTGTGLGLAIAKQIADRHNIKISVKSELNKYTKFTFTI